MHVPKCAGSSVNHYICSRWDSAIFGRGIRINDVQVDGAERERLVEKGRRAGYVYGHMSWATMSAVVSPASVYVFTFLRQPLARLHSLYRYNTGLPLEQRVEALGDRGLATRLGSMTPLEFFGSSDRRLRYDLDNFTVRQFAGSLDVFPRNNQEWMEALQRAKDNLRQLNYVGFQDQFSTDFDAVASSIGLPRSADYPLPHRNASAELDGDVSLSELVTWGDDVWRAAEPLMEYDNRLYAWARNYFAKNNTSES